MTPAQRRVETLDRLRALAITLRRVETLDRLRALAITLQREALDETIPVEVAMEHALDALQAVREWARQDREAAR